MLNPETLFDRQYRPEYNRREMTIDSSHFNLCDYLLGEQRLREIGQRTAIEFRGERVTYNERRSRTDQWVKRITSFGIAEDERVALLLYDSPEFIACFLATVSIGAICVPINTFLPASDVAFILSDCGARLLIVENELSEKLNQDGDECQLLRVETTTRAALDDREPSLDEVLESRTTPETPALLLYTSGSTGAPKGVIHTHGAIPFTCESYAANVLRFTADDRIFSSSRLFFAYGLGNSLSFPLSAGATVLLHPERMSAEALSTFIEEQTPTVFFGVPAVYLSLIEFRARGGRASFTSVRRWVSAGESLPAKIFEDWQREFGQTILDGIGSTEMLHIFISNREGKARAGSSGVVVEGYAARLLDDFGAESQSSEPGNLWVSGASASIGYWNRPDLTEQTMKAGWVRTGDVYRGDDEGFFYHIGRSDDCFKVNGLWVSPIEVESVLMSHKALSECAVVAGVDKRGLATARAFVVIREGEGNQALIDDLRKFAMSRLPHYKVPSQIEFVEEMPRTSTGKIQRYKLRAEAPRQ